MNMTDRIQRPSVKQLLLLGLTAAFLILLTVMVLQMASGLEELEGRIRYFILLMGADVLCLMLLSGYSMMTGANIQTFICAVSVLFGIGSCYQFLFDSYLKQMGMVMMGLIAGGIVCCFWRRRNGMTDRLFYCVLGCIGGLLALMMLNMVFGKPVNGAYISIDIFGVFTLQPAELVKILLILLGACSYRSMKRSVLYSIAAMASCVMMLLTRDLGSAVVTFAMFVLMTYLLFDNRVLSLSIIAVALVGFVVLIKVMDHAAERFTNWTNVMEIADATQQQGYIKAVLYGGFSGLGLENSHYMTGVVAAKHDGALAGVMAVYGVPMAMVTLAAYAVMVVQTAFNRSVYPSNYMILSQISMFIFCQVILNFCGALDVLPFTGLVAPLISHGGTAALTFGVMLGLEAAALYPAVETMKEE